MIRRLREIAPAKIQLEIMMESFIMAKLFGLFYQLETEGRVFNEDSGVYGAYLHEGKIHGHLVRTLYSLFNDLISRLYY